MAVWRSGRLHRSQCFGSVGENKNKASEHKQNSDMQLPAQFLLFKEMSIIESRFILTLYSSRGLASHLSTQNQSTDSLQRARSQQYGKMVAVHFVLINVLLFLVWRLNCTLKADNLRVFDFLGKKKHRERLWQITDSKPVSNPFMEFKVFVFMNQKPKMENLFSYTLKLSNRSI